MKSMAECDGAVLLASTRWDDTPYYLHELLKHEQLPHIARIVKGHYLSLGVPSLSNPQLSSQVFLQSVGKCVRIAAQCVKFKDHQRVVNVGPKLAIPETFKGYFEILNEDGKAVRCIESVAELARRFPEACLVREACKAYISRSDQIEFTTERPRLLPLGEMLILVGEIQGSLRHRPARFLRCFDSKGSNVYLPWDLKAKFSPIAQEDHISGVHPVRNLLSKRLPLMVRMASGTPPRGLKPGQQFCMEMRLLAVVEEEIVVAWPLLRPEKGLTILPPTVPLKMQIPHNASTLKQSHEFRSLENRCCDQWSEMADQIQVYDSNFSQNLRFDGQQWRIPLLPLMKKTHSPNSLPTQHLSTQWSADLDKEPVVEETATSNPDSLDLTEEDCKEIDQIYDYIRGMAPCPSLGVDENKINSVRKIDAQYQAKQQSRAKRNIVHKSEKKNHNTKLDESAVTVSSTAGVTSPAPRFYRKSISHQPMPTPDAPIPKPRMYRQHSAMVLTRNSPSNTANSGVTPVKQHQPQHQALTSSPLFYMRYKSMSNLMAADSDNTLGSSQSGGRCSGGSAGSAAVRVKDNNSKNMSKTSQHGNGKIYRPHPAMHRPRSLTSLLLDVPSPLIKKHPMVVADITPARPNRPHKHLKVERHSHHHHHLALGTAL